MKEYSKIPGHESYFDFSFFLNNNIKIENFLVYGFGFQKSGWIEPLTKYKDIYKKPVIGGVIDEHILFRIGELQKCNKIGNVTISYFKDDEREYLKELIECFDLHNIELKYTSNFDFKL